MNPAATGVMYLTVRRCSPNKLSPVKVTLRYPPVLDAGDVVIAVKVSVPQTAFQALDGGHLIVPEPEPSVAEVSFL